MRKWTFNIPTVGEGAKRNQWFVIIPVNYTPGSSLAPGYGQWDAYVPGPIEALPWAKQGVSRTMANDSADAIPDTGEPFIENPSFVLLTQLGNGGAQDQSTDRPGKG